MRSQSVQTITSASAASNGYLYFAPRISTRVSMDELKFSIISVNRTLWQSMCSACALDLGAYEGRCGGVT